MAATTQPSTATVTYAYDFDGRTIEVTRHHIGTAYPRNGNVHNPTEYFQWEARVDGSYIIGTASTRTVAYEYARAHVLGIPYRNDEGVARRSKNVRRWDLVRDEMTANYRGRVAR